MRTFALSRLTRSPGAPFSASAPATWRASSIWIVSISAATFRDIYYEKRRKNLFLVNMVCTDPERDIGEECFCLCADTGPAAREHFDLQLMDLGDEFMAVAGTPAGEALLAEPDFPQGTAAHVEKRRAILAEVRKRFQDHDKLVLRHRPLHLAGRRCWKRPGRKSAIAAWNAAAALMSARPALVSPSPTGRRGRTKSSGCASGIPAP